MWLSKGCWPAPAKGSLDNTVSGSLTTQGPAGDSQTLLRPCSSHPAYSNPETILTGRWDNKVMGYPQLKVNKQLLLSTAMVLVSLHTSAKAILQGTKLKFYYWSLQVNFGKAVEK